MPNKFQDNIFSIYIYSSEKVIVNNVAIMDSRNGHYYVIYSGNNSTAIENALRKRGNWYSVHKQKYLDANLIWRSLSYSNRTYQEVDNTIRYGPTEQILMNHFQFHPIITNKSGLIKSLRYYYSHENSSANNHVFDAIPTSFVITPNHDTTEYKDFQERFMELSKGYFLKEKTGAKHCVHNVWFIKPEHENQGKGIGLTNSLKQIEIYLKDKPINSVWVVQKSIERPLLYFGRKFDVRVWVLVTPYFEVYYYKVPYIRTSNRLYEPNNLQIEIHLTNNAQQKKHKDYSKFQQGNTLPFSDLEKYLRAQSQLGDSTQKVMNDITSKMKSLIIDTLQSAKKYFTKSIRKKQFELFGYDFLIDEDYKVWLLEVNNNPYIGCPNDFIRNLVPLMIDEMFEIILDPYFRPVHYTPVEVKNFQLIYRQVSNFRINPSRHCSGEARKKSKSIMDKSERDKMQLSIPIPTTLRHKRKTEQLISLSSTQNVLEKEQSGSKQLNYTSQTQKQFKPKYLSPQEALKYLLDNYCYTDVDPFISPVTLILNSPKLLLQEPEQVEANAKCLKMVTHSRISHILLQSKFLPICADILISPNYPEEIKSLLVEGYEKSARTYSQKITIMKSIVPSISKLLQTDVLIEETKNLEGSRVKDKSLSESLLAAMIALLIKLGGHLERKIFIPGQSRENQFSREYFIKSNTFSLLLYLKEKYPNISKKQTQQFFQNVNKSDWQMYEQIREPQSDCNMSESDPSSRQNSQKLYNFRRLSINTNLLSDEKPKILPNTERHTTEIRTLRSRRQSGFPVIRR